jgi:putative cell wall-binding protein
MKKFLSLLVVCVTATIILLGVFGLTACSGSLDDYKATKSQALQDLADAKITEDNYCENGLAAIGNAVSAGKKAIEEAKNKQAVDMALTIASDAISEIPREDNMGTFYGLQKAYDDGLITLDDLRSIAYYQSGGSDEPDILPIPKNPENLNEETEQAIKETYMVVLRSRTYLDGTPMVPYAKTSDVTVLGYYGTYNGAIAIKISDSYSDYPAVVKELEVAGVTLTYSGAVVTIWKANQ